MSLSLRHLDNVDEIVEVKNPLDDKFIRLKHIAVISLKHQFGFSARCFHIKQHTIAETWLSIHTAVMSIRSLHIIIVYKRPNVHIGGAFDIHGRDVETIEYAKTDLEIFLGFTAEVPIFFVFFFYLNWVNIDPHS